MSTVDRQRRLANRTPNHWAEVTALDPAGQRVALINDWGYTVAEIMQGQLRVNDVVEASPNILGRSDWWNLSTDQPVIVNVTHIQATRIGAAQLLGLA